MEGHAAFTRVCSECDWRERQWKEQNGKEVHHTKGLTVLGVGCCAQAEPVTSSWMDQVRNPKSLSRLPRPSWRTGSRNLSIYHCYNFHSWGMPYICSGFYVSVPLCIYTQPWRAFTWYITCDPPCPQRSLLSIGPWGQTEQRWWTGGTEVLWVPMVMRIPGPASERQITLLGVIKRLYNLGDGAE